jgi:16S rRNA processing protein rimM
MCQGIFFLRKGKLMNKDNCLRVGTYVNTHGIKGEIKVYPHTDDVTRFSDLESILLDTRDGLISYDIESVKYFKNMAIIKLAGIDNINDIEKYKGSDIYITRAQAVPLEEGEYFLCDIIDAEVISDDAEKIGTVKEVLQTGANDVYVVGREGAKDLLIPVIPSCVLDINTDEKRVIVHLIPGLSDI